MTFVDRLANISVMEVALTLSAVVVLWVLYRVQRSPKSIDFVDLMLDTDGKASWTKMTAIGAFAIATWVIVFVTLNGKLSEWLFDFYIAVYSGGPIAYKIISSRSPAVAPPSTVTVTAPAGSSVQASSTPSENH